ncbi:hypothetical protein MTO96_037646 [Rhipicephalus appendiculatus]
MFSLDEFRSRYDSGGAWSSDLTYVTRLTERAMNDHFGSSHRQQKKGWAFKEWYIRRIECKVYHRSSGCDMVFLRSICLCSMKSGHYRQLVALWEADSHVVQAYCDCVAGHQSYPYFSCMAPKKMKDGSVLQKASCSLGTSHQEITGLEETAVKMLLQMSRHQVASNDVAVQVNKSVATSSQTTLIDLLNTDSAVKAFTGVDTIGIL